ncbi:MAG: cob(I)yrinic acid a,c-diamide adenosyltransferase [Sulfuricella sp.]|nr:cob(I)yrinic acid a,c-diamide adenosyltransferase [Sulfuricella sp.]
MGYRLSNITTRTGDDGTTGLADGTRAPKDGPRIGAIGEIDELNSQIGAVLAEALPQDVRDCLAAVQHTLFDLGGELSVPGLAVIEPPQVAGLEALTGQFNAGLPPLEEFILPGGTRAAAQCHVARAVCRRTERACVHLNRTEPVSPELTIYLNRLSDLLFVLCRVINRAGAQPEVSWRR